jgi:hypothetical protein
MNPTTGAHYRKVGAGTTDWRKVGINLLQLNAGRSNNTTNTYLNNASGVPTDQEGYILPYDARLVALAATTRTAQTWDGEIHLLLTPVAGAVINVVSDAADTYILPTPINFNANDELQFFGRGSSIDRPTLYAYLEILT